MQLGCNSPADEAELRLYLNPRQLSRFHQMVLLNSVRVDGSRRCCPTPDCFGILECDTPEQISETGLPVDCSECKKTYCFSCLRTPHPSLSCKDHEKILRAKKLLNQEDEIREWAQKNNAKPCPKCQMPIEKSEGCNHVHHRSPLFSSPCSHLPHSPTIDEMFKLQ